MEVLIDGKSFVENGTEKYVEVCKQCDNIDWFISDIENLLESHKSYLERDSDILELKLKNMQSVEVLRDVVNIAKSILKGED